MINAVGYIMLDLFGVIIVISLIGIGAIYLMHKLDK